MKIITITGIDKSGKTSIIDELHKKTNFINVIADRDISTYHFFNELTGRVNKDDKKYQKDYNKKIIEYRKIVDLSVLLTVNELDWKIRCETHKEQSLIGELSFKDHQNEIARYFNKAKYKNVLKLNTTEKSIDECVEAILRRL